MGDKRPPLEGFTGAGLQKYAYTLRARDSASTVRGTVFDGCAGLEWRPATLRVGVLRGGLSDVDRDGNPLPAPAGALVFLVRGLLTGAIPWIRRFSLSAFRNVCFDITPFEDCSLEVIGGSLPGYDCAVYLDNALVNRGITEYLTLSERYTVGKGNRYLVPPGASRLFPEAADAAFTWGGFPATGLEVAIPEALTAGVGTDVKGTSFIPSADIGLTWRIEV
jgi:hypothetical protein